VARCEVPTPLVPVVVRVGMAGTGLAAGEGLHACACVCVRVHEKEGQDDCQRIGVGGDAASRASWERGEVSRQQRWGHGR
jgi:hypothetical protein